MYFHWLVTITPYCGYVEEGDKQNANIQCSDEPATRCYRPLSRHYQIIQALGICILFWNLVLFFDTLYFLWYLVLFMEFGTFLVLCTFLILGTFCWVLHTFYVTTEKRKVLIINEFNELLNLRGGNLFVHKM